MTNVRDDIRATKELARLTKLNLLLKIGKYRYTRYIINPKIVKV